MTTWRRPAWLGLLSLWLVLTHASLASGQGAPPPQVPTEAPPAATDLPSEEILVLRAEVLRRDATILDLRRQLALERAGLGAAADQAIAERAQTLEALFRAARQPPAGAVWDWETLTFKAVEMPPR